MVYIVNCNISAMHFKMDMTIYALVNSLFLLPSTVCMLISAINDDFFFFQMMVVLFFFFFFYTFYFTLDYSYVLLFFLKHS